MHGGYYKTSRLIQVIVSSCVLLVIILVLPLPWVTKVVFILLGSGFGYLLGHSDWNKTALRIDKRNVVILYATDGWFYGILILLFFIQFAPRSVFRFTRVIQSHPYIFHFIIGAVCSSWVGYNIAFWRGVAHFESAHGRLITKQFWSRSSVGQEGMVLRQGFVVEECAPTGKVQVGSEIWKAESIDGKPIEVGQAVIVRDIEGLKFIVERSS